MMRSAIISPFFLAFFFQLTLGLEHAKVALKLAGEDEDLKTIGCDKDLITDDDFNACKKDIEAAKGDDDKMKKAYAALEKALNDAKDKADKDEDKKKQLTPSLSIL